MTDCLSAEDINTHCSTDSRGQQLDPANDVEHIRTLPDSRVDNHLSCNNTEELKSNRHKATMKQFEREFSEISQVYEDQARIVGLELLTCLQEVDLRLDVLKDRMEHLEPVSVQEVYALWEEVQEEVKMKKIGMKELDVRMTQCETERTSQIRLAFQKCCCLLQKISFLSPSDVLRLIHNEAMTFNHSVLASRRSVAQLLLLLHEDTLQQESLLRLHWEDHLRRWRRRRVDQIVDRFRSVCTSEGDCQLVSDQQMTQKDRALMERRCDIIAMMSSLVPPSCSTSLVSDWFDQLTAVNKEIGSHQRNFIQKLRCCYKQMHQERLSELKFCKGALSSLQLSEEEVNNIMCSQILPLLGQRQKQHEEQLAALELHHDSVTCHALSVSKHVFVVMRGAALLWETHQQRLQRREEELQWHLEDLRDSQQQNIQGKKVHLDKLLAGLRRESSEEALKTSLDQTVCYLQDIRHCCSLSVSAQCQLFAHLPSLHLEEFLSYSRTLSSFYHLNHTYTPSPEDLQNFLPSWSTTAKLESAEVTKPQNPEEMTHNQPIRCQNDLNPAQTSQDWLTEAESCFLELCDINSDVTFTSSGGMTYTGPAFRCPVSDLPDEQKTHLSMFSVELLTQTLSRTRALFMDHLEQHVHDVISSAVTMVTDRKETMRLEQELQLQQLDPEHITSNTYQLRQAELQLHRQRVEVHFEEVLAVLASIRAELQELQRTISKRNKEFVVMVTNMECDVMTTTSSQRLDAVCSALQDCLEEHKKQTQHCESTFRRKVQMRLEEVRTRTTQLSNSFRLFSEGGDYTPQELKLFQRRLKEESKHLSVSEENIFREQEEFQSMSFQQVKEVTNHLKERLHLLMSEIKLTENIQNILRRTQLYLQAEVVSSNQQHSVVSCRLNELKKMMGNMQVCPYQVCSHLSSFNKDLMMRCQYLDFSLKNLAGSPKSKKQVQSGPGSGTLQPSRAGVDLLGDLVVGVTRSLNRFCMIQDATPEPDARRRSVTGQSAVQQRQQRGAETVSTLSMRRSCRSIRLDRRYQVFGPEPDPQQYTDSFSSRVTSVLWRTNDELLQVGEDFYRSERSALGSFLLLPDTLDQWADSMQQRLLGYQEHTRRFLSTSRDDLMDQLSVFDDLLCLAPSVLIGMAEREWGMKLVEEVGGFKVKLDATWMLSEKERCNIVRQLRVSLRDNELMGLSSREELRQQQLHRAICHTHLQIQECVQVRGEEFVTSLESLTENLLQQLDNVLTCAEQAVSRQIPNNSTVTTETSAEQNLCTASRVPYFCPPTSLADMVCSVTMATTVSMTTTRCTRRHLSVIEQRDAAVKRFGQLLMSELSQSEDDKQQRLQELQNWNTHWRQRIHILTHTH